MTTALIINLYFIVWPVLNYVHIEFKTAPEKGADVININTRKTIETLVIIMSLEF